LPLFAARPAREFSAAGTRKGFRFHDQAGPVHPGGIGTPDDDDGAEEVGAGSWRMADGGGATAVAGTAGDDPIPDPISRYPTKRIAAPAKEREWKSGSGRGSGGSLPPRTPSISSRRSAKWRCGTT